MAAIVNVAQRDRWTESLQARVAAVISDRPQAGALALAASLGIASAVVDHAAFTDRAAFEVHLMRVIDEYDPDGRPALVVLAGFMRVLGAGFVNSYQGRLVNIHPSLLPAFAGLHTHRRALAAGCRMAGATVHLVTQELDAGPILAQAAVPVLPGDSEESLARRVLSQEHLIYPRAIARLLADRPGR